MKWDQAKAALELAAAPVLERIRQDQARAPWRLKPMLAVIEEELFDPDLTVGRLLRQCRASNHNISMKFRQELGDSPWRYITLRRLEIATHLLSHTDLRISDIGALVGSASASRFGAVFRRWMQMSPSEYREKMRESAQQITAAPPLSEPQHWHLAEIGALDEDSARRHWRRFLSLYPQIGSLPVPFVIDGGVWERMMAEEIWRQLEARSLEEQQAAVRHQFVFSSPVFFYLLSEKSREEGRKDRQRGIHLAELALRSIEASGEVLGEDAFNYRAEAWARIGNAKRLALDFPGADQAFARAAEAWREPRGLFRPEVEAEISSLESALRMNQRRFGAAARLSDEAVRLARTLGQPAKLSQYLVQRGSVWVYSGEPLQGIPSFTEARHLAKESGHIYFEFSACTALVTALAAASQPDAAEEALQRVQALAQRINSSLFPAQLEWMQGLLLLERKRWQEAEGCLIESRSGFLRYREMDHAAVVSLDLAALYLQQRRSSDSIRILTETLPLLETLKIDREFLVAVELLREAVSRNQISVGLVQQVRQSMECPVQAPPKRFSSSS